MYSGPPNFKAGRNGAQALAGLKEAPALHALRLYLSVNNVGDNGAEALAGLKEAPVLHTLYLDLVGNKVGASGAQAFQGLQAPALRILQLNPQ